MTERLSVDAESNGFLEREDFRFLCIGMCDLDTGDNGAIYSDDPGAKVDGSLEDARKRMMDAEFVVGHNVGGFDFPGFDEHLPGWVTPMHFVDTMACARLLFPLLWGIGCTAFLRCLGYLSSLSMRWQGEGRDGQQSAPATAAS